MKIVPQFATCSWLVLVTVSGSLAQSAEKNTETPTPAALWANAWRTLDKGLGDDDSEHRKKAIEAVGTIGDVPDAVERVVHGLHDKSTLVRQTAAETLGEMGAREAIPELKVALDDDQAEVSFTAAKALASLGDASGRELFWQVMQGQRKDGPGFIEGALKNAKHRLSPGQLAVMGAKEAAGLLGPASIAVDITTELIKDAKKSSGAAGRVVVAEVIAKDPDPNSVSLLEWALRDDSSTVRAAVAKALGECGNPETPLKLAPLLSDDSHSPRYMAAAAIIKLQLKFPEKRP